MRFIVYFLSVGCGRAPADIVFVLDSSASEGLTNFQKQLDFVRDFTYQFQIGPQAVQVSQTQQKSILWYWKKRRLTPSAPNFRNHLSSVFFFKQTITWKEVYM